MGDCPGLIIVGDGVGKGVRVGEGRGVGVSSGSGVAVGVGRGVGVSVGDGVAVGVGVGVLVFAFELLFEPKSELKFESVLKLKLASTPRFVLTFRFSFAKLPFVLTFVVEPPRLERNQKPMAPIASSAVVPSIVRTTTRNVFGFFGGGA